MPLPQSSNQWQGTICSMMMGTNDVVVVVVVVVRATRQSHYHFTEYRAKNMLYCSNIDNSDSAEERGLLRCDDGGLFFSGKKMLLRLQ